MQLNYINTILKDASGLFKVGYNGQLIGEGREIVARLPMPVQKFNSATTVQNTFFTPAFRQ